MVEELTHLRDNMRANIVHRSVELFLRVSLSFVSELNFRFRRFIGATCLTNVRNVSTISPHKISKVSSRELEVLIANFLSVGCGVVQKLLNNRFREQGVNASVYLSNSL